MADNLHIQNPSITSGALASMFAFSAGTDIITAISGHPVGGIGGGGGGTPTEGYWRPIYNDNTGDLSWLWSIESTANTPTTANIKGPSGASGAKGEDGFSPTVTTAGIDPTTEHPQGGTSVTITDKTGPNQFNVWNGINGEGASVNLLDGNGIHVQQDGINYTISVSADYSGAAVTSAKNWVNAQGYVIPPSTTLVDSYWFWNSNQTDSGWKALQIVVSADGRLCSIGENNVFFYESGGMNDVLLQGYANTGTYEDFAQGYENSAFQYALVQGRYNKAHMNSLAQGYHNIASGSSFAQGNENIAEFYSLAQGYTNSAVHYSLAQGYENTASKYSFAQGTENIAFSYGLSQGVGNRAESYSIAQGQRNQAFANSQAFGLSTIASGSSIDGHHYGMMSIGSYNATTAGALFVIGNGYAEDSTNYRSDAFIVYKDGHVSAAGDIWANGVKLGAGGGGIVGPTGTGVENKYWLYSTYTGNSWIEANTWLCNNFICENGISGVPDMSLGKVHIGLSGDYLPTSGGTVSGSTYFSAANGQNMLAVASAATLIGASRQTSEHFGQDTNALGTTWLGVGGAGMYRGFLKYTQGGNVGDLDSNNTMQVEFTPNNKGTIFAKAKNSGNDCPETQILNPTKASCDAMTQSANANLVSGPNYMLAKNADGQFVIGAACINCTAINDVTLAPNTYYFVYEV